MPNVTRWFIKAGLIYFILSVTLALVAEIPALGIGPILLPVYWHMLVIGWITQVIMGVSIWMFPRKHRHKKRRESMLSWLTFWLLNAGLMLRFLSEPFLPFIQHSTGIAITLVASSVLQVAAIGFYIAEMWPRLQPRTQRKRT
ncbi:MAG: hypothetical protein ACNA78_09395 [Balneolaceae bacterium]